MCVCVCVCVCVYIGVDITRYTRAQDVREGRFEKRKLCYMFGHFAERETNDPPDLTKVNGSYERVLLSKGQSDVKAFEAEIGNCRIPRSLARVN